MTPEEKKIIAKRSKEELHKLFKDQPDVFNDTTIDFFLKTLLFKLPDSTLQLDGLETRVPFAFKKILDPSLSQDNLVYFPDFVRIEPFLKKILYLIDKPAYNDLQSKNKGLAAYINKLGLNTNNIRFDTADYKDLIGLPDFAEQIFRTYTLRNTESHNCELWSKKEIYENIESVLVFYLFAVHRLSSELSPIINTPPSLQSYLQKVILDFEVWQQRFVHIIGKEKFEEIDLYAIESDEWTESNIVIREGKIDELRANIEENVMVVLGEPGMGKSTSLQYIAYNDANKILNNSDEEIKIPIYVELKLLSLTESIMEYCEKRLGVNSDQLNDFLQNGQLSIFLDGLNEVHADKRKPIRLDIQNIISLFPLVKIIITSRPLAYSNEFKDCPVFILQKMEINQVEEFLTKNCPQPFVRRIILNEINENQRFGKIVRVPLLLKMLINVVLTNKGTIPPNKVQIIKQFIQNLYTREKKKLMEVIDMRIVHRLLCFLAFKTRELNGSNVGCLIEDVESILEQRIELSRFEVSVYQFLDIAIDLNILVQNENKFSFIHELYQEYYASEEFYRINVKQK